MKKRIVALLLCCVMLLTLSPSLIASASAEEETQTVATTEEPKAEEPKATEEPTVPEQPTTPEEPADPTEDESKIPQTVVFTDAGPFLPAANVAAARSMLRAAAKDTKDDSLKLNKTAKANNDGTYTITMEAYTTGKVTTVTKTTPVDIVLVLDQSGSMAYNFAGDSTSTNSERRQYAMKQAVNAFVAAVGEKYSAEADHRIAIVTFDSSAKTLQNWTYVNSSGISALQNSISNLTNSPSGGTQTGAGMQQAETLMGSGYNYTGKNATRQKVVILFTDGVPGQSGFDDDIATKAIKSAYNLKKDGVTVYSVGIFSGANVDQLHDNSVEGNVGDDWDGVKVLFWGDDMSKLSIPAANRFMNYLCSNFENATEIGLDHTEFNIGIVAYERYAVTKNFDRTNTGYYLTANDANSLSKIFQTISENIQTSDIDLGKETVIKDTITPYFDVPANTTDIKLYTADAKADGTFENRELVSGNEVKATISGNAVSVTGFDFNANFVSKERKSDGTYGKKLIIEFTVQPKAGFLGGNNVPTNGTDSGIYSDGNLIKEFEVPTVDVEIPRFTVNAVDKNVYLTQVPTDAQLKAGATAICNGVNLLDESAYTGTNAWKAKFVTISTTTAIAPTNFDATVDGTYTLTVTVMPKDDGSIVPKTDSATGKINVFKPEVTFKDSQITLGETADYADNKAATDFEVWKHGTTTAPAEMGAAPTLVYAYDRAAGAFQQDTPVKVLAVKIGNTDVTSHVTFYRDACDFKTDCPNTTVKVENGDVNFIVHVKSLSLIITKDYDKMLDPNQSAVFEVSGPTGKFEVVIHGTGSVTINGLPIGNYTVTEKNTWTWRYTDTTKQTVELTANGATPTVEFENKTPFLYWLTGGTYCDNRFDGKNTTITPASN